MFKRILTSIVVSLFVLSLAMPVLAGPASDKDFKAASDVISAMSKACKAKDKEKVKTFLTKAGKADIEKDPSIFEMFLELCAELGVDKNSKATVEGNKMDIKTTWGNETTGMSHMVKEDGKWKFGEE